jgi:hypothetical protein
MASPEPTATTLTLYCGLSFSNAGISTEKSPESCVEVVDARTISLVFGASLVEVPEPGVVVAGAEHPESRSAPARPRAAAALTGSHLEG